MKRSKNFFLVSLIHVGFLLLLTMLGKSKLEKKAAIKVITIKESVPQPFVEHSPKIEEIAKIESPPAPTLAPPPPLKEELPEPEFPPPSQPEPEQKPEPKPEPLPEKKAPPKKSEPEKPKEKVVAKTPKKVEAPKKKASQKKPEVKKASPKKEVPKKKNPPSKKAASAKPVIKKSAPKKPQSNEELLKMMNKSLANVEGTLGGRNSGKNKKEGKSHTKTLGSLASENIIVTNSSSSYANELASFLKRALVLPEMGEVRVRLTLTLDGKMAALAILESTSSKNKNYVEKKLASLRFPSLPSSDETIFQLTLKSD